MCGFGGIVNSSRGISRESLTAIAKFVSHRGPDSTGLALFDRQFNSEANLAVHAFFFNRLAILDLDSRSDQPFQDEQSMLVFNGEIYNYKEIRTQLISKGIKFSTTSDTEVLFRALQQWGEGALPLFNGMFSFFYVDKKARRFLAARDRLGIKPLYYRVEDGSLMFASEIHSIVRLSRVKPAISRQSELQYLVLQYVPTPNTILDGVCKLPPGHFIQGLLDTGLSNTPPEPRAYWDGYSEAIDQAEAMTEDHLEQILTTAIQQQLVADVPVGLFLSSGVDSSLLAALVNRHFGSAKYDFFTVAFDRASESDESGMADRYIKGFNNPNLRHHKLELNAGLIATRLDKIYDRFDEPFGDHASLLNWAISEKARERVTVVLSGDGADELFWGYPRYREWEKKRAQFHRSIPGLGLANRMLRLLPESSAKYKAMSLTVTGDENIYMNMLRPWLYGFIEPVEMDDRLWYRQQLKQIEGSADLPALIDLKTYLPDAMLYKVDRASMAASLEVRVPYLDNSVLQYALKLTHAQKSSLRFKNKAPLKELLTRLAPHFEIESPKRGFNFPLKHWMKNEWGSLIQDTVNRQSLMDLGLDASRFESMVHGFYRKDVNCTNEVWYVFNLLLWHEKYKAIRVL